MKILTLSKRDFESNFNNTEINKLNDIAFISILDCSNLEKKYTEHPNFLQVYMWDIEEDVDKYKKPEDLELQKIINFVNLHTDKKGFIIHCSAGISRSGAVARYLFFKFYDKVDVDYFNINNKYNQPNLYIFNRLLKLDNINIY